MSASLLIFSSVRTLAAARTLAERAVAGGQRNVIVAGEVSVAPGLDGVVELAGLPTRAAALEHALLHVTGEVLFIQEPDAAYHVEELEKLAEPIRLGQADVVVGVRPQVPRQDAAVARLAHLAVPLRLSDLLCGQKAVRVSALRALTLRSSRDDVEGELLVELAAQQFRFTEVAVTAAAGPRPFSQLRALTRLFLAAAKGPAGAAAHGGYAALSHLESGARNYVAWLGRRIARECGLRVLEVGAGIGTTTSFLAEGREKVVALDVDASYVEKLRNRFRGDAVVEPWLSAPDLGDEAHLKAQRFDTVVMSNVLEHIEDDGGVLAKLERVLEPGGRLILLVPALPQLFGSLDVAVGHHRRYTAATLRAVVEAQGFTVETLEWMNLVGIPGWLVNGRLFKRESLPPVQMRVFDRFAALLARAEEHVKVPVGLSLFCVATKRGPPAAARARPAPARSA